MYHASSNTYNHCTHQSYNFLPLILKPRVISKSILSAIFKLRTLFPSIQTPSSCFNTNFHNYGLKWNIIQKHSYDFTGFQSLYHLNHYLSVEGSSRNRKWREKLDSRNSVAFHPYTLSPYRTQGSAGIGLLNVAL